MQRRLIHAVHLAQPHPHIVATPRRQVLAHVIGPNRQLAMAPIDQHRQLDRRRPPVVDQRVQRRPNRASGEEHVVDQHDHRAVDIAGNAAGQNPRRAAPRQIVAVEAVVDRPRRNSPPVDRLNRDRQPLRQRHPARLHPHQHQRLRRRMPLNDLVRDPRQRPAHPRLIQHRPGRDAPQLSLRAVLRPEAARRRRAHRAPRTTAERQRGSCPKRSWRRAARQRAIIRRPSRPLGTGLKSNRRALSLAAHPRCAPPRFCHQRYARRPPPSCISGGSRLGMPSSIG